MNSDSWLQVWKEQPLPQSHPDVRMIIQAAEAHRELDSVDRVNVVVLAALLLVLLIHYFVGQWNVIDGIFTFFPVSLAVQLFINWRERRRQSPTGAATVLKQLDRDILRTTQWLRARRWLWVPPRGLGLAALVGWLVLWLFNSELSEIIPQLVTRTGWKIFGVFVGFLCWGLWCQWTEHRDFLVRLQELTALRDQFRSAGGPPTPVD